MQHLLMMENALAASAHDMQHRWSSKAAPWLVHTGAQGKTVFFADWILSPGATGKGNFLNGLRGGIRPASPAEWMEWTQLLFNKGMALDTLLSLSNRYGIKPLSLWIMLPYCYEQQERVRLKALLEWAGTVRSLWVKRFGLSGHRLEGFVWGREAIPDGDIQLVQAFNEWVRNCGLNTMWLANYGSTHVQEWNRIGFTHVSIFSNYTGKGPYTKQWLDAAMSYAIIHHMGLQSVYGAGLRFEESSHGDYLNAVASYRLSGGEGPVVHRFIPCSRGEVPGPSSPIYEAMYRTVHGGG